METSKSPYSSNHNPPELRRQCSTVASQRPFTTTGLPASQASIITRLNDSHAEGDTTAVQASRAPHLTSSGCGPATTMPSSPPPSRGSWTGPTKTSLGARAPPAPVEAPQLGQEVAPLGPLDPADAQHERLAGIHAERVTRPLGVPGPLDHGVADHRGRQMGNREGPLDEAPLREGVERKPADPGEHRLHDRQVQFRFVVGGAVEQHPPPEPGHPGDGRPVQVGGHGHQIAVGLFGLVDGVGADGPHQLHEAPGVGIGDGPGVGADRAVHLEVAGVPPRDRPVPVDRDPIELDRAGRVLVRPGGGRDRARGEHLSLPAPQRHEVLAQRAQPVLRAAEDLGPVARDHEPELHGRGPATTR